MRDDFSTETKEILAKRVGYHCSNPNCKIITCGPRTETNKFISIGVAAHITAASPNGPRHNALLSKTERGSVENGIWLCQNCSKLIDNDTSKFTVEYLRNWKIKAEQLARNKLYKKTSEIVDHPELLEQLSTFGRISFQYSMPFDLKTAGTPDEYMQNATKGIYDMIVCSYLKSARFMKRDKFVFVLSFDFEIGKGIMNFYGELITHLTPFGYYFGVLAEMLNRNQIDELIEYINSVPFISYRRQLAFGKMVPFKISRVNPAKIEIESNPNKMIFEDAVVSTSDLLILLAQSSKKGITVIDDINDAQSFNKLMNLYEKIENGFDFTEVSIDINNPEAWTVRDS